MKGDTLYWFFANELDHWVWGGEMINRHNLPDDYPVVFISNHAAALGPIAVMCSLSIRVYPWVISDMLKWDKAAEYLRKDFIEPQLKIPSALSRHISKLLSQISVRLLNAIECIPVWQGTELLKTYHLSVDALVQGKSILIFPEDPGQTMNELYGMTPFYKGFTRLGEMYYERTKKALRFCPLAVHPVERKINVGKSIAYNPYNDAIKERIRIKQVLESTIHDLYLNITFEGHIGVPLAH
jgi:hypothetical protein